MLSKSNRCAVSYKIFLKICKAFVLGRIRNLLWPGLAKEESIAHITPILSHHYCAQVMAVFQKDTVNLRYM